MTSLSSIQSAMSIVIFLSKSIFFHIYYIFTQAQDSLARPQKNPVRVTASSYILFRAKTC